MKAVISSTYDSKYLYFIPITVWCWNKLNVDVICFMPYSDYMGVEAKNQVPAQAIRDTLAKNNLRCELHYFNSPEHKRATYSQCSRLYASCLDLPEEEILVTSDADMALFRLPPYIGGFTVLGHDLVPQGQFPMCYISAKVKDWRRAFNLRGFTYQQCLDGLLGDIDCDNMRGNYWAKDQEEAYFRISSSSALVNINLVDRARPGTQCGSNRIDRDDSFWEERLNLDVLDAHLWRPGYTEENFPKILKLLKYFYPNDDFKWLVDYTNAYKQLL